MGVWEEERREAYATPVRVVEPPQPIMMDAWVNDEMTKLGIEVSNLVFPVVYIGWFSLPHQT